MLLINFMNKIYKKSPMQKKKLEKYLTSQSPEYLQEFSHFIEDYDGYLKNSGLTMDYCIDAYLKMVKDMFSSQIKFMRTGQYPVSLASDTFENIYNDEMVMTSYMIGLAISQYLWETHYKMFEFFKISIKNNRTNIKNYTEIGPGHGLFLKSALDTLDANVTMTAIDISPVSLDISKSIIDYFHPQKTVTFINQDMINLDLNSSCDFIVMGEVLEHVEKPEILLQKINSLLAKNGKAFLSTCVNCPAIDHIYHFKTVDEIRAMFYKCGLIIESEKVLPVEHIKMDEIVKQNITINYAAVVTKAI